MQKNRFHGFLPVVVIMALMERCANGKLSVLIRVKRGSVERSSPWSAIGKIHGILLSLKRRNARSICYVAETAHSINHYKEGRPACMQFAPQLQSEF